MKRIKYACIEKTLHFQLKDDLEHTEAVKAVQHEAAHYREVLERKKTKYRIIDETTEPDGSIIIKIKMQYNDIPCGDYLD